MEIKIFGFECDGIGRDDGGFYRRKFLCKNHANNGG